jgi:hypothetical protein
VSLCAVRDLSFYYAQGELVRIQNLMEIVMEKNISEQKHLTFPSVVNLGSFYTPQKLVALLFDMLAKKVKNVDTYTIIDTSCGYGSFLKGKHITGYDIDKEALIEAGKVHTDAVLYHINSLKDVKRDTFHLSDNEKVIIIGNPPYNDVTSIVRNNIKLSGPVIDADLKRHDLGLSFLLSYNKLSADYVCVLHPLSYLIKKTNFNSLHAFTSNYTLRDSLIVSSGEFSQTSRKTQFPIIIALYERNIFGMNYDDILHWQFKTIEGNEFVLYHYDSIGNYITKYPNKSVVLPEETIAYFWTMRDINTLKRTKTFFEYENANTIRVRSKELPYYCYVDIFKEYIKHIPYYFGNCDVFINDEEFEVLQDIFVQRCYNKYAFLHKIKCSNKLTDQQYGKIDDYFKRLIGKHYL